MSSERYSESRTIREENRTNFPTNNNYRFPNDERVNLPIQQTINRLNQSTNEQRLQERLRQQDTTLQWINDPITGQEKFRIHVNIDGFNPNEIKFRVDGNKLSIFGEHSETNDQSTAKKVIEKTYDLPRDIDGHNSQVTYPSSTIMQLDFSSRHSNVIIDDGRIPSKHIVDRDSTFRTSPCVTNERSSTEYTSTRKLGNGSTSGIGNTYLRASSPRTTTLYDDLAWKTTGNNYQQSIHRDNTSSNTFNSTNNYPLNRDYTSSFTNTNNYEVPVNRDYASSFTNTNNYEVPVNRDYTSTYPLNRDYTSSSSFNNSTNLYQPRTTTLPSTARNENSHVREQTYSETRREVEQHRSSPTTGVQTSREIEHHRSGSPTLARTFNNDRFGTALHLNTNNSILPSTSTRNIEVREVSRRVGNTAGSTDKNYSLEPMRLSSSFNSDAFYRSAFQPKILTDNSGQQYIEMILDVNNYQPNEIKIAVEHNDLIVKAEHNVEQLPSGSSRNYFYKQITLPPNTDFNHLKSQYHADGRLHITAKLI